VITARIDQIWQVKTSGMRIARIKGLTLLGDPVRGQKWEMYKK